MTTRKSATSKKTTGQELDYAALSTELAEVMARLEGGELGIDEAVSCYERGLAIVSQLEGHLQHAENRVQELRAQLSGGTAADSSGSDVGSPAGRKAA
ncbi:MAG TPA: exodeoxyribonuclease VII small subunit [Candidatus Saccharimonadales bacterium]|jgi:exodeoxyribonuclease VII small subunit